MRVLFTGDVLLSRLVAEDLSRHKDPSSWNSIRKLFLDSDYVIGNLEGAVGSRSQCMREGTAGCFNIDSQNLGILKNVGFNILGLENNHSMDLGPESKLRTARSLIQNQLTPLLFQDAPLFMRRGQLVLAVVPVSVIAGADGKAMEMPSLILRQKLRLARRLADWVIVYIHWGAELMDWPQEEQVRQAHWLLDHGADIVMGHHPHVVARVDCVNGRPVFYSLGNFLFDQRYPQTKIGLVADCRFSRNRAVCKGWETQSGSTTYIPSLTGENRETQEVLEKCSDKVIPQTSNDAISLRPAEGVSFGGGKMSLELLNHGHPLSKYSPSDLLAADIGKFSKNSSERVLFALERHLSDIDHEYAPRPYIYRINADGRLTALWRGSALAWPISDAQLICTDECYLCALHRGDSFLVPNPNAVGSRTAIYKWNGFGFSGFQNADLSSQCAHQFDLEN